jgi:hypothetical protein
MIYALVAAGVLILAGVLLYVLRKPILARHQRLETERAMQEFRLQREVLEARFFDMAAQSGKPRGLRWLACDWLDGVAFGRDKQTGMLTAFVSVNIRFEAIEGGDMEGVAAVSNIRDGSALFHYHGGGWGTGGRALFNMNPQDALSRLETQYEPVRI